MNIHEMHIGLDLGLQKLSSNVFNNLLKEEKDHYLNTTTKEIVRAALLDEKNTIFDAVTYMDIRRYYETLQYYIRQVELNVNLNLGYPFIYGNLPANIPMGIIKSGVLYKDIPYKVLSPGAAPLDLSNAGGPVAAIAGDVFICNPPNLGSGGVIITGETYRIINSAGVDFSGQGAPSNVPGTVFTATSGITLGAVASIIVEKLTVIPDYQADTELTPTSNFGYFNYLSTRSSVRYGQSISSGTLTIGKKYYVHKPGTTDLTTVGGKLINDVGFIFTCTAATSIDWTGGTVLYEVLDAVNRIVKYQDIYNFLDHSYGSAKSSPLCTIASNRVQVYHNYKFDVYRVYLDYIKEPVTVSKENEVSSDLPVSMHSFLIDTTIKYIQATYNNSNQMQQAQQQQ